MLTASGARRLPAHAPHAGIAIGYTFMVLAIGLGFARSSGASIIHQVLRYGGVTYLLYLPIARHGRADDAR
jgi:threonine/homoserine/homoserine lactone efflux protein